MPNTYYDGDYTVAQLAGQPLYSAPFEADPKLYLYSLRYWQFRVNFTSLALDSSGPFGGYHVGETDFKDEGAGVISWARNFALVPDRRSDYESFAYPFQEWRTQSGGSVDGDTGTGEVKQDELTEYAITIPSRIQFDYFHTIYPADIPLGRAERALLIFGKIYFIVSGDPVEDGTEVLAEDAQLRRWKGNIYERQQRFVLARSLA